MHLSADGGQRSTKQGGVEAPTAFTAGQDGSVVVATDSEILRSTDRGTTFEPVAELAGDH